MKTPEFTREAQVLLAQELQENPAVAVLGARQVGKTTLALELAKTQPSIYLDLESEQDRAKLAQPELYLAKHLDKLVVIDEVHLAPGLFGVLRGLIDQARRQGKTSGSYLLLGSASLELLKQSGETLAGRISYVELNPLNVLEVGEQASDKLWQRGGFPNSFRSSSEPASLRWRQNFIRSYLERDIPQFGPRLPTATLRQLWTMLAHQQGGMLNTAQLARNLGVSNMTAASYVDLLVNLLLVRRLPTWHANVGKRLVKSPKIYVRDSGVLHALLGIGSMEVLLSHPVIGGSWEGFVIENIASHCPFGVECYFYRSGGGAEIDLVLSWPNGQLWAIEIKRSLTPKVERGFHAACVDLQPTRKLVVYPGTESYPLGNDVQTMPLAQLCQELRTT